MRVLTALTIVSAVAGQLQYLVENNLLNTANFLSYFTIQSNVLACLVRVGLEMGGDEPLGRFARWARGGATLFMTMTGLIDAVTLSPVTAELGTQQTWVNAIVHIVADRS